MEAVLARPGAAYLGQYGLLMRLRALGEAGAQWQGRGRSNSASPITASVLR